MVSFQQGFHQVEYEYEKLEYKNMQIYNNICKIIQHPVACYNCKNTLA